MFLTGLLKTPVCKFLVSSFRVSELPGKVWQKNRPKNSYLRVLRFCFRVSPSVFFSLCPMNPLVLPKFLLLLPPATQTTRAAHSMIQAWTQRAERCRPKMVLERILPPLWSGLWWETDHPSPSALRIISPDPHQTQCPAHHLTAVQIACPSPPLTESQSTPRHRRTERQCWGSPWSRSRSRWWRQSRCESRQQSLPRGRMPRTVRAHAADSESAEKSSAPSIVAEGELIIQLGLLDMGGGGGGDLIDWETDLEIELALSSLRHPRWFRPALIRLWFPFPALRRLPILQYPLLKDALQCPLLENARPPTHSCLLHRCFLAAPLLALSPPSMRCELGGTVILQHRRGQSFPWLRLQPPRPGLHLGTLTHRLHHGS